MSPLHPHVDPDLRIKLLTPENWLDVDPASDIWVRLSVVGAITIRPQEWTEHLLAVDVSRTVPLEVRRLFAVARGVMLYGSFFYPLWGLGAERLFLVADAAITAKYEAEGGSRRPTGRWPSYKHRLDWLLERGLLDQEWYDRWDTLRDLRNAAAHPEAQTVFPPGQALSFLTHVARDIDALFN
jgi:hypothetical protein